MVERGSVQSGHKDARQSGTIPVYNPPALNPLIYSSYPLLFFSMQAILHDEEVKKRHLLKLWRARTRERGRHSAQEVSSYM